MRDIPQIDRIIPYILGRKVVCFCGAGLSQESGVPTFRGHGGLWEKYDAYLYASREGIERLLKNDVCNLKEFIVDFYNILLKSRPNYAHYVLAEMEKEGILVGIISQNIDDFSYQAGSQKVAELHGNAFIFVCWQCGRKKRVSKQEVREFLEKLERIHGDREITEAIFSFVGRCPECDVILRPSVVLFGEPLPDEEIEKANRYLNEAETLICVGTSGIVYPAAYFPYRAYDRGFTIINVNPEPTALDEVAKFKFRVTAVDFFKKLKVLMEK